MGLIAAVAPPSSDIAVTETLIVGLMLVASLVGIAVSRLRLPYTVALVLVGLALGLSGAFSDVNLTSDLILLVFLPPLLFEGAINMDLDGLVARWKQVAVLAVAGTALSALVMAGLLSVVPGTALEYAAVFAVVLAATDPVSVLAILKENGVGSGLRTLMEGESIFNDALAIVAYLIVVDIAFGESAVTVSRALTDFGTEVVVGVGVGAAVGFLSHRLMSTLDDHLIEITLALVTAYGAYLVADRLHGSGVIATVTAGLLIGNYGTRFSMSPSGRVAQLQFWEVLAFLANSALFLIIGLEFHLSDLRGRTLAAALVAIVGMLAARAILSYGLLGLFRRSARAPVPTSWLTAVFWGGLRGSIPIALAIGLPVREVDGINVVAMVFTVVLFSLIVQAITYRPLLDRLGLTSQAGDIEHYERLLGETLALRAAIRELEMMRRGGEISAPLYKEYGDDLDARLGAAEERLAELTVNVAQVRHRQVRITSRRLAAAQKRALADAARGGRISDVVARDMSREIDLAVDAADETTDSPPTPDLPTCDDADEP